MIDVVKIRQPKHRHRHRADEDAHAGMFMRGTKRHVIGAGSGDQRNTSASAWGCLEAEGLSRSTVEFVGDRVEFGLGVVAHADRTGQVLT